MKPIVETTQNLLGDQAKRYAEAVDALPEDALTWQPGAEMNSVAQLVRHVTAVQMVFLLRAIGETPQHDHLHSLRNDPATQAELHELLDNTAARTRDLLPKIDALDMSETLQTARGPVMRAAFVERMATHGAEHLGHAELTRQLWEQRAH